MAQDPSNVKRSPSAAAEGCRPTPALFQETLCVLECLVPAGASYDVRCEGLLGCWREPPYAYFFFAGPTEEKARASLEAVGFRVTGRYELAYAQWQRLPSRILDVGPFRIAFGPFDEETLPHLRHLIALNPGLVFGSGMHPTTQLCLRLLGRVFRPEAMTTVVDLGTGTGVLALAAARLGARRVVAVDVNPLAVREAAANVRENGLSRRVFLMVAESLHAIGPFGDLLLMNLEWPGLRAVLETDGWKRFPWVLCSGYLHEQAPIVQARFSRTHKLQATMAHEGWEASFWAGAAL
uniref:Methyltransferase domain-containing protein n=1 Tax=Desulfacinum infernum TaxID=35837 RepID=A0A832EKE0_9BACT